MYSKSEKITWTQNNLNIIKHILDEDLTMGQEESKNDDFEVQFRQSLRSFEENEAAIYSGIAHTAIDSIESMYNTASEWGIDELDGIKNSLEDAKAHLINLLQNTPDILPLHQSIINLRDIDFFDSLKDWNKKNLKNLTENTYQEIIKESLKKKLK